MPLDPNSISKLSDFRILRTDAVAIKRTWDKAHAELFEYFQDAFLLGKLESDEFELIAGHLQGLTELLEQSRRRILGQRANECDPESPTGNSSGNQMQQPRQMR
jgi:hypothetical protein